jgi:hypothetical protein
MVTAVTEPLMAAVAVAVVPEVGGAMVTTGLAL